MSASPLDETVGIDGLDCAAAAGSHDECRIRAGVPYSHRMSVRSAKRTSLRERRASCAGDVRGDGHRSQPADVSIEEDDEDQQAQGDEDSGQRHAEVRDELVVDPPEHREREREGADENRERRLQHAVAVPEAHDAGRERPGRHLHDENGHGDDEAGERSRRADDRGQDRARGRRRVLPERGVPMCSSASDTTTPRIPPRTAPTTGMTQRLSTQALAPTEPPGPSHLARPPREFTLRAALPPCSRAAGAQSGSTRRRTRLDTAKATIAERAARHANAPPPTRSGRPTGGQKGVSALQRSLSVSDCGEHVTSVLRRWARLLTSRAVTPASRLSR